MEPSWHVLGPEPARVGPAPGQYRQSFACESRLRFDERAEEGAELTRTRLVSIVLSGTPRA
jgi:hypothetical protein